MYIGVSRNMEFISQRTRTTRPWIARTLLEATRQPQTCSLYSSGKRMAASKTQTHDSVPEGEEGEAGKARDNAKQKDLLRAFESSRKEYRAKMHELRVEFQKETREKKEMAARKARLEYARIQKAKASLDEVKRQRAAEGVARAEKRAKEDKERYEARWRECWRILEEREERKDKLHALLLKELEWESQFWITSQEHVAEKIDDKLWEHPGASTTGGEIAMPDEHLWRFAPDVGLPDADEEPMESQGYLRLQMMERMGVMRAAKGYVRQRKKRWVNDTRGVMKEADRIVQAGGAPKGWLERSKEFRAPGPK